MIVRSYPAVASAFPLRPMPAMASCALVPETSVYLPVAVGTVLRLIGSDRPPHRSQRAALPHWAPTSGPRVEALFALLRTRSSSLCAGLLRLCVRSAFRFVALPLASPLPSTVSAATDVALFDRFIGTMGLSDFPLPFITGFGLTAFPARPAVSSSAGSIGISRFSCSKVPYVRRVFDRAGTVAPRVGGASRVAFRFA